jgi:hypothetical protein
VNITLHIEQLILDGLPIGVPEARAVEGSLRRELTRLLAEGGIASELAEGGMSPSLPSQTVGHAAPQPGALGQQIARATYRSVGAGTR